MNELIYFPYFEPRNEEWLKFSLLTLDEFRPIIPEKRLDNVSDKFKMIQDETNLIKPYTNLYEVTYQATENTKLEIQEIYENYEKHKQFYNFDKKERVFENKEKMTSLIYRDKFHDSFATFCQDNNFAIEMDDGLFMSDELSNIFMKNLAKEICQKSENKTSLITDNNKFNNYLKRDHIVNENELKKMNYFQTMLSLAIPNTNGVSYEKIISFRKSLEGERRAFNQILNDANFRNLTDKKFLEELKNTKKSLNAGYLAYGITTISIPFIIQNHIELPDFVINDFLDYLGPLSGYAGIKFGMTQISQEKISAQKYFFNLEKLSENN